MILNKKRSIFFYLMIIIVSLFIFSSNIKMDKNNFGAQHAKSFECKGNIQSSQIIQ